MPLPPKTSKPLAFTSSIMEKGTDFRAPLDSKGKDLELSLLTLLIQYSLSAVCKLECN